MGNIVRVNEPPPPPAAPRPTGEVELATAAPGRPLLYLTAETFEVIKDHIDWGEVTDDNVVEQGGLLVGRIYLDGDTGDQFAVVDRPLEARASHSSQVSIEMNHATWADLLRRFHALASPEDEPRRRIVGWYHTHPNSLDVFMSGTDRRTQRDFFAGPEFFALVFNPHRLLWKAFQGADCIECAAVAFAAAPPPGRGGAESGPPAGAIGHDAAGDQRLGGDPES